MLNDDHEIHLNYFEDAVDIFVLFYFLFLLQVKTYLSMGILGLEPPNTGGRMSLA